jgi:[protein-PII] uridylyltransferase
MLLTLADGMGVGDEATWSDWKESLVWQLYRSTKLYLADDVEFFRQRRIEQEELRTTVLSQLSGEYKDEVEVHFTGMPERYFLAYSADVVVQHVRFFRRFFKQVSASPACPDMPVLEWIPNAHRGHTELWVCGWDRHAFLARIAGSLSAAGFNILSADAFTRMDSLVLDIFRICTREFEAVTDPVAMQAAEKILRSALQEEDYDFSGKLSRSIGKRGFGLSESMDFPTRIAVENSSHPTYTLVDVQTPDRLGLLYSLLQAFGDEGLEIAFSRVNTEKGAAFDSFYITDELGKKVTDSERLTHLQKALWKATEQRALSMDDGA